MTQENFRKLFPDITHVSTHEIYLEIVSGKSPESRPKTAKPGKSLEKFSGISPESPTVFWK